MIISFVILGAILEKRSYTCNYKISFLNKEVILILIIFSFFSGVRYAVGVDYLTYKYYYQTLLSSGEQLMRFEWLFTQISLLFSHLNMHFASYFSFLAFIQLFFILYSFKNEKYLYPSMLFVLMTNGTYFMWMNGIRQIIAMSIFIFSIQYIKEKKIINYMLLVLLAFLFHKSALLLIPLYFVFYNNRDLFRSISLQFILIFIALYLSEKEIWSKLVSHINQSLSILEYESYIDFEIESKEFNRSLRFYLPLLINCIIVLYSKKLKKYFANTIINIVYNLFFLGVLLSLLFYDSPLMQRPAIYFIYVQFIMNAYLLVYLRHNLNNKVINRLTFISVITFNLLILYAWIYSDFYTQYTFFWDV